MIKYVTNFLKAFLFYFYNHIVTNTPSYTLRHAYLKYILKIHIGKKSAVHMGCFITGNKITIGNDSVINRKTYLDGRFGISIGNGVSISPECYLLSLSHDVNDLNFRAVGKHVYVDDFVWLGARSIILPGINLAKGTVVAAGSVVTKSVNEIGTIVGGVPAKIIGVRNIKQYNYSHLYFPFFDTDITG
jgi:acetyltransferase-like isoleucine patch superfamily enzyme